MAVLVLVVDDEPDVEALFRQQFRRELRAERFVMPGMTGLEMLPKMKKMRPDVPVIMITTYGDDDTKRKAIESGAEGLLTKPIDFALLREQIDTRLGRAV